MRTPCVLLLSALLLLLGATPPAQAAENGEWAVYPAAAQLGSRPYFFLTADPGSTVTDRVTVANKTAAPLTFRLYGADAYNTDRDGGFAVRTQQEKQTGAGAWITPERTRITVPARSAVTVPYTLSVPADADPGDHPGALVALDERITPGELFGEPGGRPAVLERGGHLSDAGGHGVVGEQRPGGGRFLGVPYVRARERLGEQDVGEGRTAHQVGPVHAVGQRGAVEGGEPAPYVLGVGEVGPAGPQERGVPPVPGEVPWVGHGPLEVVGGVLHRLGDLLVQRPVEPRGERPHHGGIGVERAGRGVHEGRQVLDEQLPHERGRRLGHPRPPVGPTKGQQPEHRLGGTDENGVAALGCSVEEAVEPGVGENGLGHASQGSSAVPDQAYDSASGGSGFRGTAGGSGFRGDRSQWTSTVRGAEKSPQVPSGSWARRVTV